MPQTAITAALESSADPLVILDENVGTVWSNSAFQRLSSGKSLAELTDPRQLREICATTHYATREISLRLPSGKVLTQSAVVLDIGNGDPSSSLFLIALKSTNSENTRLAARQEFLATVAHDLRNPLSAIFAYADALVDTAAGEGLTVAQREIMKRVRSTSARCVDLILNYQLLSQVQGGAFLRARASVDLNAIARNVVDTIWREDPAAPTLSCVLAKESLPVFMEKVQLDRILSNIVSNALKYTPPEGAITLKTGITANRIFASVNNTGAFIPQAELATLFDRYTRASTNRGKGGSGLGLYIVKTLVEANGGSVEIESSKEKGVTFTLYFPRT